MDEREAEFEAAMRGLHAEAKKIGYNASRFIEMVERRGGVGAAKHLVNSPAPSDGFIKLWELGRLDLSVEALMLQPSFKPLFTPRELGTARKRLESYGWTPS